jgi:hypothetical protein
MTPDERKRMNELSVSIQEEKDYGKFAAMLYEMSELIERKEQRRFPQEPKVAWTRNKPSVSMPARATRLLPSIDGPNKKVEITIPAADDLFREIRIENRLLGLEGNPISLASGAELTITVEAEISGTVPTATSRQMIS